MRNITSKRWSFQNQKSWKLNCWKLQKILKFDECYLALKLLRKRGRMREMIFYKNVCSLFYAFTTCCVSGTNFCFGMIHSFCLSFQIHCLFFKVIECCQSNFFKEMEEFMSENVRFFNQILKTTNSLSV